MGMDSREKHIANVEHDVYLREVLLAVRRDDNFNMIHLNECHHFALTLDRTLVYFDKRSFSKQNRGQDGYIPCFFLPAFLLKKLYKIAPVVTDDYQKAFVASITQPVLKAVNKPHLSFVTQNAIIRFKAYGIDNMNFIMQCITDEIFLDEFSALNQDEDKEMAFLENHLSKDIERKTIQITQLQQENLQKEASLSEKENVISLLNTSRSTVVEDNNLLLRELKKIRKDLKNRKSPDSQSQFTIFNESTAHLAEEKAAENQKLVGQLELARAEYARTLYDKWKVKPIIWLLVTTAGIAILLFGLNRYYPSMIVKIYTAPINPPTYLQSIVFWLVSLLGGLFDVLICQEIFQRYHNHERINAFKASLVYPPHLQHSSSSRPE